MNYQKLYNVREYSTFETIYYENKNNMIRKITVNF